MSQVDLVWKEISLLWCHAPKDPLLCIHPPYAMQMEKRFKRLPYYVG